MTTPSGTGHGGSSGLRLAIPDRAGWAPGFHKLCEHLAARTGCIWELLEAADFDAVNEALLAGLAHIGLLSSVSYVQAKSNEPGLQYIATAKASEDGSTPLSHYNGTFITLKTSDVSSLDELKGQRFAFVSPSSSSGFMYPVAALQSRGITYETFFGSVVFAGDHPLVTGAVASGEVSGGATWEGNLLKAMRKHGDIFRHLGHYGPIVNHAAVANINIEQSLVSAVASALVELPSRVSDSPGFPYAGFEVLSDSAYDAARAVANLRL